MDQEYVLYALNVEDAQNVALEAIDRELTDEEIKKVENRLDDYFSDWFDVLEMAIHDVVGDEEC